MYKSLAAVLLFAAACGDDTSKVTPDAPDNPPADAPVVQQPDRLELPGDSYYPENLAADAAGTLYVGSLTTGQVVAFKDGESVSTPVIATPDVTAVTGVEVQGNELWICSVDLTFQKPTELRSFALDGTPHDTFPLGATQFCNDVAFDAAGNAYVADSTGGIISKLPAGGSAFETFATDARFAPVAQGAFALDGIVVLGDSLYVNTNDTGQLFQVALADASITEIAVTPPLGHADGMKLDTDGTLLVVDNNGSLTRVTLGSGNTATSAAIATGLDQPTGVALARGSAWVSLGQIGKLFSQPPVAPNLPFAVVRVDL